MNFSVSTFFLTLFGLAACSVSAQSPITLDNHFEDWSSAQSWTSATGGGNINKVAISHTSEWVYLYIRTTDEVALDETTLPNSIQIVTGSTCYY